MREITVGPNEAGQRLDKLLGKHLRLAPKSFLYKMLRKKNITLNRKKAEGSELTSVGDTVQFFLSEETYAKFSAGKAETQDRYGCAPIPEDRIVYEDGHILLINKPVGMLSQKSAETDISANERIVAHLLANGSVSREELAVFCPSVCNRLDRNTSGLLTAGKTLAGLQMFSALLKSRALHKYYLCLVKGSLSKARRLEGYLKKDEASNRVQVCPASEGAQPILTEYHPLWTDGELTLLEVWLITGRTHQIRAHLADSGHPILGDPKYGDAAFNRPFAEKYHIKNQMLHAWRMEFPQLDDDPARDTGNVPAIGGDMRQLAAPGEELRILSGKCFTAQPPEAFLRILRDRGAELPGKTGG